MARLEGSPAAQAVPKSAAVMRGRERRGVPVGLACVLVGAAAFRAAYIALSAVGNPMFEAPILDAAVYDAWARRIAAGEWIGREPFYLPPLYPYLLGLLYRLAGPGAATAVVLQAALGLLNIGMIHRAGARLFGTRAGLLAAAGAALYAPFPFFETKLLGTTLGITLNLAALLLLLRAEETESRGRWAAAGAMIGAATLCTPGAVLLGGLAFLRVLRRRPRAAIFLALGLAAALAPALAHNLAASGEPLVLSAQGGITFYQGNNAAARGLYAPVPGFSGSPETQAREERIIAERESGRPLTRTGVSLHFFRKGLAWIATHPLDWALLTLRKTGYLFGNYEAATEYSLYEERGRLPILWLACLPYAVIAGCGVAGWWRLRRDQPVLALYALYGVVVPLLFFVSSRYRTVLVPALLLYGATFVDRVIAAAQRTRAGPVAWGPRDRAGVTLAAIVAFVSLVPLGGRVSSTEANARYNLGNVLAAQGKHEEAIAAYDGALALWPDHALALVNRGNSLMRSGRMDEAMASYLRAEDARPGFWPACRGQALILRRRGQLEEELEACRRGLADGGAEAQRYLGSVLERLGRIDGARAAYARALVLDPTDAAARAALMRLGE